MRWMFSWHEHGRLQVKIVGTRAGQALDAELQDRNIYATVRQMKARPQ